MQFASKYIERLRHPSWMPSEQLTPAVLQRAQNHSEAPEAAYETIARLIEHKVGGSLTNKSYSGVIGNLHSQIEANTSTSAAVKNRALQALDLILAERTLDVPSLASLLIAITRQFIDLNKSRNRDIVFSIRALAAKHRLKEEAVLEVLIREIERTCESNEVRTRLLRLLSQRKNSSLKDLPIVFSFSYIDIWSGCPDDVRYEYATLYNYAMLLSEDDAQALSQFDVRVFWQQSRNRIAPEHQWRMYIDGRDWHKGCDAYEKNEPGYLDGCRAADAYIEANLLEKKRLTARDIELLHFNLVLNVAGDELPGMLVPKIDKSFLDDCCGYDTQDLLFALIKDLILEPAFWEVIDLPSGTLRTIAADGLEVDRDLLSVQIEQGELKLHALQIARLMPEDIKSLRVCDLACEEHQVERTRAALIACLRRKFRTGFRQGAQTVTYGLEGNQTVSRAGLSQVRKHDFMGAQNSPLKMAIVSNGKSGTMLFCHAVANEENLRKLVETILENFYEQMSQAKDRYDRLESIVTCCQSLVLIHPFIDGNSRVTYALLRLLLAQAGEPPTYLENPGCLAGFTPHELINKIRAGQIKLRQCFSAGEAAANVIQEENSAAYKSLALWQEIGTWENAQEWCSNEGPAYHFAPILKEIGEYPETVIPLLNWLRSSPLFDLKHVPIPANFGGIQYLISVLDEGNFAHECRLHTDQFLVDLLMHINDAGHADSALPKFSFTLPGTSIFHRLATDMCYFDADPIEYAYASYARPAVERLKSCERYKKLIANVLK